MNSSSLWKALAFILVSICWPIGAKCPSNLDDAIGSCISGQILLKNKSTFIGIDMERLRVMCSEFYLTMRCFGDLVTSCPEHTSREIETRINALEDLPHKELMHDLCKKQDLYEKYSIHYFCISGHKKKLHQCFHTFEKSIEPFVNSHDMTAQVCSPVDSLMSCMDAVMTTSCSSDASNLMRILVGPLMPHGVDVKSCPAISGEQKIVKSPEKTSPEHYKVLYDNNSSSSSILHLRSFSTFFVLFVCFLHFVDRVRFW